MRRALKQCCAADIGMKGISTLHGEGGKEGRDAPRAAFPRRSAAEARGFARIFADAE
jgi:hypothetical protein